MRHLKRALWPHYVDIDFEYGDEKLTTILPWLQETFGTSQSESWNVVYRARTARYYFREEKDAAFFALRWL
jgi:hypothetical protein